MLDKLEDNFQFDTVKSFLILNQIMAIRNRQNAS